MYGTKEEKDAAIRDHIETKKKALAAIPHLIETVQLFDRKILNCRFEKRLRDDGNIWRVDLKTSVYYGDLLGIVFFPKNHYYNHNLEQWLANVNLGHYGNPDNLQWYNKRIPAQLIIADIRKREEKLKEGIAALEKSIELAPTYQKQLDDLERQMRAIVLSIPSVARDVYELNYNVTH